MANKVPEVPEWFTSQLEREKAKLATPIEGVPTPSPDRSFFFTPTPTPEEPKAKKARAPKEPVTLPTPPEAATNPEVSVLGAFTPLKKTTVRRVVSGKRIVARRVDTPEGKQIKTFVEPKIDFKDSTVLVPDTPEQALPKAVSVTSGGSNATVGASKKTAHGERPFEHITDPVKNLLFRHRYEQVKTAVSGYPSFLKMPSVEDFARESKEVNIHPEDHLDLMVGKYLNGKEPRHIKVNVGHRPTLKGTPNIAELYKHHAYGEPLSQEAIDLANAPNPSVLPEDRLSPERKNWRSSNAFSGEAIHHLAKGLKDKTPLDITKLRQHDVDKLADFNAEFDATVNKDPNNPLPKELVPSVFEHLAYKHFLPYDQKGIWHGPDTGTSTQVLTRLFASLGKTHELRAEQLKRNRDYYAANVKALEAKKKEDELKKKSSPEAKPSEEDALVNSFFEHHTKQFKKFISKHQTVKDFGHLPDYVGHHAESIIRDYLESSGMEEFSVALRPKLLDTFHGHIKEINSKVVPVSHDNTIPTVLDSEKEAKALKAGEATRAAKKNQVKQEDFVTRINKTLIQEVAKLRTISQIIENKDRQETDDYISNVTKHIASGNSLPSEHLEQFKKILDQTGTKAQKDAFYGALRTTVKSASKGEVAEPKEVLSAYEAAGIKDATANLFSYHKGTGLITLNSESSSGINPKATSHLTTAATTILRGLSRAVREKTQPRTPVQLSDKESQLVHTFKQGSKSDEVSAAYDTLLGDEIKRVKTEAQPTAEEQEEFRTHPHFQKASRDLKQKKITPDEFKDLAHKFVAKRRLQRKLSGEISRSVITGDTYASPGASAADILRIGPAAMSRYVLGTPSKSGRTNIDAEVNKTAFAEGLHHLMLRHTAKQAEDKYVLLPEHADKYARKFFFDNEGMPISPKTRRKIQLEAHYGEAMPSVIREHVHGLTKHLFGLAFNNIYRTVYPGAEGPDVISQHASIRGFNTYKYKKDNPEHGAILEGLTDMLSNRFVKDFIREHGDNAKDVAKARLQSIPAERQRTLDILNERVLNDNVHAAHTHHVARLNSEEELLKKIVGK